MLSKLLEFYREDPQDPFNIYALALEYQKTDSLKALAYYKQLLDEHADYLPAYYHAAALMADLEQVTEAEAVYLKGIELAGRRNNTKTLSELTRAFQRFQEDQEEW